MRVKSAEVTALVNTGESERRARYLKQAPQTSKPKVTQSVFICLIQKQEIIIT